MAITNVSDYNLATAGAVGTVGLNSANPFYSSSLNRVLVGTVTATGDQITYKLDGAPDLSQVIPGAYVKATKFRDNTNNGIKKIVSVNDTTKDIVVDNDGYDGVAATPGGTSNSGCTVSVSGLTSFGMFVHEDLTISTIERRNHTGQDEDAVSYTAGNFYYGDFSEITVSAGEATVYLRPERVDPRRR